MLQAHYHRFGLLLLVFSSSLPFIHQAFHIDDRIYLEISENILKNPLFPYDYSPIFEGLISTDAASHSHLPLVSYYLAFIKYVTGSDQEWVYHLAFIIFPVLAAMGFYDLARRYIRFTFLTTCLFVVSPAFYVLSHTLMVDVPLLAFWLLSISLFLKIADGEAKTRDWILCGVCLMCASLISLISAGLVLLMLTYLMINGIPKNSGLRPFKIRLLLTILLSVPLLLWLTWYCIFYLHYDRFVLINTLLHMHKRQAFSGQIIGLKTLSFFLNIGATFIFPLSLWVGFVYRTNLRVFVLLLLVTFVPFYTIFTNWSWQHVFLFASFFSTGVLVFWHFIQRFSNAAADWLGDRIASIGSRLIYFSGEIPLNVFAPQLSDRDFSVLEREKPSTRNLELIFLLWFFGILISCVALYYSGSVRYTLLACPPVVLLWAKTLENRVRKDYFLRKLIWSTVVLTGLFSFAVAYGDYRFSDIYRNASREIYSEYARPNRTIWFTGEWGYRYYFEKLGAQVLTRTASDPKIGDIIVKPFLACPWVTVYDGDKHTQLLEQRKVIVDYPIRILDFSSHAGFYSTGWGLLPFSIGNNREIEWFNIFQVVGEYVGPTLPMEKQY